MSERWVQLAKMAKLGRMKVHDWLILCTLLSTWFLKRLVKVREQHQQTRSEGERERERVGERTGEDITPGLSFITSLSSWNQHFPQEPNTEVPTRNSKLIQLLLSWNETQTVWRHLRHDKGW